MAIFLAYDGSVNGDWIARYAVNFAAHEGGGLTVLHVETAEISSAALADKLENIERVAGLASVPVDVRILPMRDGIHGGLLECLPEGNATVVVCGVRARASRQGFLRRTISEQLLNDQRFMTVALRVVQPGLLGSVQRLLMPVAGHRPGIRGARRLLGLLAPFLRDLHLLHVVAVGALKFRRLSVEQAGQLRHDAQLYLDKVEQELASALPEEPIRLDALARVSDDWVREILLEAGRFRADLVAMEAPRASVAHGTGFGDPLEIIFRDTPCDVAIFRGPDRLGKD